ncbi:ATP-dependent DNA helicase pif1 [Diplonema papillatum]|nr:ATP-dependent DNA helicase pif1 [Diplonema papillatum]
MQDDRFLCMPCDRHFGTYSYARQHQTTEGHKAKLAPEQPALAAGDLPREVQDALALLSHMCPVADSPLADTEPDIPRIVEQYREWFEDRKAMGCAVCGTFCAQHVTEYSIALFPRLQVRSTFHVQHSGLLHVVSHGGTLYHLDAEYVDAEAGTFQACDSCSYGLKTKDGKPPACSFAAGTDFGRDLGLPDLTVVERFLIARTVSFATLLKIRLPRTGVSAPFTGHSIAYAHTGPQSLGRLPRTDAAEAITVLFVGPSADASKTRAGLKKLCEVRPPVVLQWLRFLRKHNEKYADIQIAEDVSHLEGLADSIVDGMVCIEEEDSVRIDKAAGSSNQQPDDTTAPQHGSIEHVLVDEPVHQDALQDMMRHCRTMAAHARGAAAHARDGEDDPRPTPQDDPRARGAAAHARDVDRKDDPQPGPRPVRIQAESAPLSEFGTEGTFLFAGGMPHLFPVCRSTSDADPLELRMTTKLVRTLLFRRASPFREDANFGFLCFNQKQRFALMRSIAKVAIGKNDVFDRLMATPDLLDRIDAAIQDPNATESVALRKLLAGALQFSTRAVPFTNACRRSAFVRMQSLVFFCGLPSVFVTVSPADMDMRMTFRVVTGSNDLDQLPDLPMRSRMVADNPAVAAETFRQLMTVLLEAVMGVTANSSSTRTSRTDSCTAAKVGIFGLTRAQFAVVEPQGRGSLHLHGLLWTPFDPETLTRKLQDKDLAPDLERRLDEMFSTRSVDGEPVGFKPQSHPAALPLPAFDTPEYRARISSVHHKMQCHRKCLATSCFKNGPTCRFALPAPAVAKTGVYCVDSKAGTDRPSCRAEGMLFYLLKYLSKEVTAIENTLVVFKKAFELAQRFPSKAEDRDTDAVLRSKKLLMTKFGTRHLGAVEVSAQMAFAAILDHPSEYCSHDFAGVFVWAAVRYLCGPCADGDEVPDKDYADSDDPSEGEEDEMVDVDLAAAAATNPVDMPDGKAPVFCRPGGGQQQTRNCLPTDVAGSDSRGRAGEERTRGNAVESGTCGPHDEGPTAPGSAVHEEEPRLAFRHEDEKIDGLFIDEMSMLRASDLALVEARLRIAKKSNEPFGGIAVILVGDFFQLPPVMGVPLYSASAGRNSAAALGIGAFTLMELDQQHRVNADAKGAAAHIRRINMMRDRATCRQALVELISSARQLGPGDPWPENTSLIVASNAEAATATKFLSQKFARERGLPVACFSLLADKKLKPRKDDEVFCFVPGAPAIVTGNISVAKGVANGTRCEQRSLSYDDVNVTQRVNELLANASPGDIVMVPPPRYIVVSVDGKEVPVERVRGTDDTKRPKNGTTPRYTRSFKVLPGFAFTFWRCQGLTLQNVVIDLNKRPASLGRVTFEAIYVAMSRVTSPDNLFVLPPRQEGFSWICAKKPPAALMAWLNSRRDPDPPESQPKGKKEEKVADGRKPAPSSKRRASPQTGNSKKAKPAAKPTAKPAAKPSTKSAAKPAAKPKPPAKPPAKPPSSAKRHASPLRGQKKAKPALDVVSIARETLHAMGLELEQVPGDGACFFHAVGRRVGLDVEMTRRKIVEFAASHRELLVAPLLPEGTPPAGWLLTMAEPLRWADDAAMEFATTLFNRALILFVIQGDGSRFVMPVGKSHRPNPIVLVHYANLHLDLVRGELSPATLQAASVAWEHPLPLLSAPPQAPVATATPSTQRSCPLPTCRRQLHLRETGKWSCDRSGCTFHDDSMGDHSLDADVGQCSWHCTRCDLDFCLDGCLPQSGQ